MRRKEKAAGEKDRTTVQRNQDKLSPRRKLVQILDYQGIKKQRGDMTTSSLTGGAYREGRGRKSHALIISNEIELGGDVLHALDYSIQKRQGKKGGRISP